MNDKLQTDRMQFLTRLDRYLICGYDGPEWVDGRILSLKILCRNLWDDETTYITQFASHMRELCGHEFITWSRLGGTWGAAARAAAHFIDHATYRDDGQPVRPQPRWVSDALSRSRPPVEWFAAPEAAGGRYEAE